MNTLLTATLPYVNAPPHVGHALELIQADCIARFRRLGGEDLRLASGTDDNSLKNVRAAEALGVPVPELVQRHAARFRALADSVGVQFDDFVHTGTNPRHVAAVQELWHRCAARGDLYTNRYQGLYCVGCEQFFAPDELEHGVCPEHGTAPELVEEENWFFRLSRYERVLERLVAEDGLAIRPEARKQEVLAFIRSGLRDFSVSRSVARARGWGVAVPEDSAQVVFVWFDALAGYLSALGFPDVESSRYARYWQHASRRSHLLGKGIVRFHAVYWPAILLSAGLPLPTELLVHGYVTVDGRKIGKSLGNAVDPSALVTLYGGEALRWYLLRHVHSTKDSDFSSARLELAHDSELADQVGNLVSRVVALVIRHARGKVPETGEPEQPEARLARAATSSLAGLEQAFARFALQDAGAAALEFVAAANRYLDETAPWKLAREAGGGARLHTVLHHGVEAIRFTAVLLAALLPTSSARIGARVGVAPIRSLRDEGVWGLTRAGTEVLGGPPLFPKLSAASGASIT